ncbi:MAG: PLP-dependent transferase [Rhodospirillaceae bacterium]|nr:PLP-dependent transferase [Rhodospirillaceae bacterium]
MTDKTAKPDMTPQPMTVAVHAGLAVDAATGAIAPNISMSVNNAFRPGDGAFSAAEAGDLVDLPYLYARWTNPTVRQLEQRMAALEHADEAMATATGVAAIAALFLGNLRSGDHLIISDVCYAGAREMADKLLPGFGIAVSAVNLSNLDAVRAALRPNTRLIHAETPCNPLLRLTDLAELAKLAHAHGALVSVDSTVATPVATRPLDLGVDFVIHSLTKFINGHGDALGGILIGRKADIARIRSLSGVYLGAAMSAGNAWLILRGIDTLFPRMAQVGASAQKIAAYLAAHPSVIGVNYPGLPSHPQAALAHRQMDFFGGLISFQTHNPQSLAARMPDRLRYIHYAFSLGHQRSIIVYLDTAEMMQSTFRLGAEAEADYRRYAGEGLFRLSVGLEAAEDIIADLDRALAD